MNLQRFLPKLSAKSLKVEKAINKRWHFLKLLRFDLNKLGKTRGFVGKENLTSTNAGYGKDKGRKQKRSIPKLNESSL